MAVGLKIIHRGTLRSCEAAENLADAGTIMASRLGRRAGDGIKA